MGLLYFVQKHDSSDSTKYIDQSYFPPPARTPVCPLSNYILHVDSFVYKITMKQCSTFGERRKGGRQAQSMHITLYVHHNFISFPDFNWDYKYVRIFHVLNMLRNGVIFF